MESFDAEGDDKRSQQVLSTEIHQKVVEAFEVFDHENNKTVDVREIGTIVRSLGHCPSESQLQEIISDMEDAEQMGYIHIDRFLPVMSRSKQYKTNKELWQLFRIILQQKFLPASHEDLLAAFRTLDKDNVGHIDKEKLTQLFMEEGEAFNQDEMTELCNAALDPLTKSVHYKEFVHFLGVDDNFWLLITNLTTFFVNHLYL